MDWIICSLFGNKVRPSTIILMGSQNFASIKGHNMAEMTLTFSRHHLLAMAKSRHIIPNKVFYKVAASTG